MCTQPRASRRLRYIYSRSRSMCARRPSSPIACSATRGGRTAWLYARRSWYLSRVRQHAGPRWPEMAAALDQSLQQQLLVGCAWVAAGAVGARLCGSTTSSPAVAQPSAPATNIRDHELLRCASFFLLARTGRRSGPYESTRTEQRKTGAGAEVFGAKLTSVLAADVQAYGASGQRDVLAVVKARASSFHTSVLSVTASTVDASVRASYHDGSSETICCTRGPDQQVLVQQVLTDSELPHHHHSVSATAAAADDASASSLSGNTGVQLLWWAIRFLHADITRDYASQRRYLAHNASAFGAEGVEAIVAANGEDLPEEEKTVYTVPYPIMVDNDSGTVVLMFDAWTAKGELKYRGTDLMVVRDGLVERIVTVNHKSETVFSPKSTL